MHFGGVHVTTYRYTRCPPSQQGGDAVTVHQYHTTVATGLGRSGPQGCSSSLNLSQMPGAEVILRFSLHTIVFAGEGNGPFMHR